MHNGIRFLALSAIAAILALTAFSGVTKTTAVGPGRWNSMVQMKTVEPCVAHTTLTKTADKANASPGEDITYDITETNDSSGSCLLDTSVPSDGILDTLRVTGEFTLENRTSGLGYNGTAPCADPRETCVITVLDWIETHNSGSGNQWHMVNDASLCSGPGDYLCAGETTHSGNQYLGERSVDAYCPTLSVGALPDLDGDGAAGGGNVNPSTGLNSPDKCSDYTQGRYGKLVVTPLTPAGGNPPGAVASAPQTSKTNPTPLPCGQPVGTACFGAPQTYAYTLTTPLTTGQVAWLQSCGASPATTACDGIRNVAHFDMFNEQLSSSGRNHFTRKDFTGPSLDATAYDLTATDTPPQPPTSGNDSCAITYPANIPCSQTATGWAAGGIGLDLPGGFFATAQVVYTVRDDDCEKTIGNTVSATHNDLAHRGQTADSAGLYADGSRQSVEGPVSAETRIKDCPRLIVIKDIDPGSDPGLFALQIDGVTVPGAENVGNGGTTGEVKVTIGTHTVGELAGSLSPTALSNYITATVCDGSLTLVAGDVRTCTITNTRKPRLTVNKQLVPSSDTGLFNLRIDGSTAGTGGDVGDGGTTGAVELGLGLHTVSETGGTGTNLADYFTPAIGGDCAANGTITLGPGDDKTCTITNTKVPTLTVTKVVVPSTDTGTFNLKIDGGTVAACVGDGGSAAQQVTIATHTVSETACSGTNLSNYTTVISGDCNAAGSVTVTAGQNKMCTITNTRQGTLEVRKILSPSTDPGKFNLQIDGSTAGTGGNVGDGGTTGAIVESGAHTVGETAGTGTSLSDYTSVIGGDCDTAGNVTVNPGDVKVCTITNSRNTRGGFSSNTQGFWQGPNGERKLDGSPVDGVLTTPVMIGGGARGKLVSTLADSDAVLGSPSDSCKAVTGGVEAAPSASCSPKDTGLSAGALANLFSQTLALTYNCTYYASSCGTATVASIDGNLNASCDQSHLAAGMQAALGTLGLPLNGSTTIAAVLSAANTMINDSRSGAPTVTSGQLGAMNYLLGTYVNCDRGSDPPGDEDWDGVLDVGDNCVGKYNPEQEDVDGDGIGDMCDEDMDNDSRGVTIGGAPAFSDFSEPYIGTDSRRDCGPDAWPPDFNGDGIVDVFDVGAIKATFGTQTGEAAYDNRDDLSAEGAINIVDLAIMKRFFNQTCAGVDPIQPGAP